MIRQHFYPKNNIRKRNSKSKPCIDNIENQYTQSLDQQTIYNPTLLLEPTLTQLSQPQRNHAHASKHYSLIKPMQSAILQKSSKRTHKNSGKNFLLESRKKQICSPNPQGQVPRALSSVQRQKPKKVVSIGTMDFLSLGYQKNKRREYHKKQYRPLTFRFKNGAQERRQLEPKVKGWQTFADEFVDFM